MYKYIAIYRLEGLSVSTPNEENILTRTISGGVCEWKSKQNYEFKADDDKKARKYAKKYAKTLKLGICTSVKLIGLEKIINVPIKK